MAKFALTFFLALSFASGAFAQTARISGTVTDESGGVLPGVIVTATTRDGRVLGTATTDRSGVYAIDSLPAVPIKLVLQLDGFSPVAADVALAPGAQQTLRHRLSIAAQAESVTVVGAVPPPPAPPAPVVVPLPARPVIIPVQEHARESVCGPTKLSAAADTFGAIQARRFGAENGLYFAGDELVVDRGAADGLAPGQNFVARRTFRTPVGSAVPAAQHAAGLVQVVSTTEHNAFVIVVYACDEVMRGDTLAAFRPELAVPSEPAGTPAFDDAARILFADQGQIIGVPNRLVVIDRGDDHGVRAGQRFTLFRHAKNGMAKPIVLGEAVAVLVRADSTTIRIQSASDAITFSDLAAPQRYPSSATRDR